ncbi:hypothetical protein BQ8482_150029 [Mesorhizobium delmotii]|uniref:Uncharacterized protein n=1 Tax=Mesorhizobium delmotii TaxID=1631247 RepID=A0A2P9AH13_9HYPH|nr:hypothetical protein BQ8482_150029 [Mesorhizobium delmotii]
MAATAKLLISPLVGEMPSFGKEGRTEGALSRRRIKSHLRALSRSQCAGRHCRCRE